MFDEASKEKREKCVGAHGTDGQWRKKGQYARFDIHCPPVNEMLTILQDDGIARILVYNPGAERTTARAGSKEARVGERLGGG